MGKKRLAGFLARHRYCGRRRAGELLERMRSAPAGRAGGLEAEARRGVVLGLVAALKPIVAEIPELTSQIAGALPAHPDRKVFPPLFRDPKTAITAATLVAEIGDCRERYPSAEALAADAGMSPVALESGKRRSPPSAGPATSACGPPSRALPTRPATHPWAREVYRRAGPGSITRMRSVPSGGLGSGFSGAAGRTECPTTPPTWQFRRLQTVGG